MSNKRVSKTSSPRKKKKSTTQTISKKKLIYIPHFYDSKHYDLQLQRVRFADVELKWMSPETFLEKTKIYEHSSPFLEESVIDLKNKLRKGTLLDPLWIQYNAKTNSIGVQGRHRAIASKELGIKKIPVIILKNERQKSLGFEIRKQIKEHNLKYGEITESQKLKILDVVVNKEMKKP